MSSYVGDNTLVGFLLADLPDAALPQQVVQVLIGGRFSRLRDLSVDTLGYVAILGIFIALGEEIEDERGRAFVYNLEVSPDGNLLINGENFAPLFEEMILP